jgi:hypothetical protein
MLCDEIIETYTRGEGSFFCRIEGQEMERLLDQIRRAHKFVFNEWSTGLIQDVKNMKPSGMLSVLDCAKPPYDITWLEFPQTEAHHNAELLAITGKPPTKRIGFLVERSENDDLLITMGYSFKNALSPPTLHQVRVSFKNCRPSRTEEHISSLISERYSNEGMSANLTEEMRYIINQSNAFAATLTPKEKQCALDIEHMFMRKAHPAFWKTLVQTRITYGEKKFNDYMRSIGNDWYGEEGLPLFAFAFLSCRNVFETGEVDVPEKLNRSRLRRGKEPFFSYHMVDLKPDMKSKFDAAANTGIQQRRHWVRGHFKERKTGRFFWNPHLAGNPELGFVAKDYRV